MAKIIFPFTLMVEADTDLYELAYGTGLTGAALADDALDGIKQHVFHTLNDYFASHDAGYRLTSCKGPDGKEMQTE